MRVWRRLTVRESRRAPGLVQKRLRDKRYINDPEACSTSDHRCDQPRSLFGLPEAPPLASDWLKPPVTCAYFFCSAFFGVG